MIVQFNPLSHHSVYVSSNDLEIPLSMQGIISGFTTHQPTPVELEDFAMHVKLTSEVKWDPYSVDFSATEEMHDQGWKEHWVHATATHHQVSDYDPVVEISLAERNNMVDHLLALVMTKLAGETPQRAVNAVVRGNSCSEIDPEHLAKAWHIGLQAATHTLQVTTQLSVCTIWHPAQRCFCTAMPHLQYPRLMGAWYADTRFFSVKSIRSFKCAQLIGNGMGISRFTPTELKADAHLLLNRFIKQHGIMENLVVDDEW
jgi:hypothetical protein